MRLLLHPYAGNHHLKSVLVPPIDTHEIVYDADGRDRVIPVLELAALFPQSSTRKKRG